MGGGPAPRISGAVTAALLDLLRGEDNHLTLEQCRDRLAERTGVRVHPWTVRGPGTAAGGRAGRERNARCARPSSPARTSSVAARQAWRTAADGGVGGISPERLVFLDECGVLTNMARLHGRSPRGERAYASVPLGHWTRVAVLGALSESGMVAAMSVEAATDASVFHAYLDQALLPELRRAKPDDAVLVMDNLRAHKAPKVRALLDASGFPYRYLPAYSPDFTPIEPAWAKVKGELRRVAARTAPALHEAVGPALDTITPQDAAGFFCHCGYSRPS
jgi:hypothetical protein